MRKEDKGMSIIERAPKIIEAWKQEGRQDGIEEGKMEVLELLRKGYTLDEIEAKLKPQ
jgi:hypothetical protein